MSKRLTNYLRQIILKRILNHGFKAREEKLEAEEKEIGDIIYEDLLVGQKHLATVQALPKEFFGQRSLIDINFNGQRRQIKLSKVRSVPYSQDHNYLGISTHDKHPVSKRLGDFLNRKDKYKADYKEAEAKAEAVLGSITTLQKLIDTWPEIEPLIPDLLADKPVTSLAIPIASLNRVLDLPPDSK